MAFGPVLLTILGLIVTPAISIGYSEFASNLFLRVAYNQAHENIIMSPTSIQTCLALAYLGSGAQTSRQMEKGLFLKTSDKHKVASDFQKLTDHIKRSDMLKIANKIYVGRRSTVSEQFNSGAQTAFDTQAESIDFARGPESVQKINNWVEERTNHKIRNLLDQNSVNSDTSMILVNAIYFKAEWENRFIEELTKPSDFWISKNKAVTVDMMFNDMYYQYADITKLDATALEMPYRNSDLTMLFILPNQIDGLQDLLLKLENVNLLDMADKELDSHFCDAYIPKFKIEYSVNLNEPLMKMGMTDMFTTAANFTHILKNGPQIRVSDVQHKAYISVDEVGSEATAATFVKIVPLLGHSSSKKFRLDHPFVYVIKNKSQIFFIGHVAKF